MTCRYTVIGLLTLLAFPCGAKAQRHQDSIAREGFSAAPSAPLSPSTQPVFGPNQTPVFRIFGFNGVVNAPVAPPYDAANTFHTYAGQPGRGSTDVLRLGTAGAP